jgi:hypothetical protein
MTIIEAMAAIEDWNGVIADVTGLDRLGVNEQMLWRTR